MKIYKYMSVALLAIVASDMLAVATDKTIVNKLGDDLTVQYPAKGGKMTTVTVASGKEQKITLNSEDNIQARVTFTTNGSKITNFQDFSNTNNYYVGCFGPLGVGMAAKSSPYITSWNSAQYAAKKMMAAAPSLKTVATVAGEVAVGTADVAAAAGKASMATGGAY